MSGTAVLLGATGLVGHELLLMLLSTGAFQKVHSLSRRQISLSHPRLHQHLVDFDNLDQYSHLFRAEVVFICLGTTIGKARSKQAFRKVDFDYVVEAARHVASQGGKHLLVVSALGANARSSIFYNRVKGDMELAVSNLGMEQVSIFRPSLLAGPRKEVRWGERIGLMFARAVFPVMKGPLKKYRYIYGSVVARAMLRTALQRNDSGVQIFESDQIEHIGT